MTDAWSKWERDAEVSTGGDFPEVPDDLYDAMVKDVSEPETKPDIFNEGKDKTDFFVTWELTSGDVPDGTTLRQYITLPVEYANSGYLNEKSNLYKVMQALGFDMTGKFKVRPSTWQGMTAKVLVENKKNQAGDVRPRITKVTPARKKQQPQSAGAKRRSAEWSDD